MKDFSGFSLKQAGLTPGNRIKIGKRLSPSDVHLDRLHTDLLEGRLQNPANFVHAAVFPTIAVDNQGGYWAAYPQSWWTHSQMEVRAPGATSAVMDFQTDNTTTYFCQIIAGHVSIPEATQANARNSPYDPRRDTMSFLAQQALIYKEIDWATNYFVTGVWGTSTTPGTTWDGTTATPLDDIETGMFTVGKTGFQPNILVLGRSVWRYLKNHSTVVGRLDRGQTSGGATVDLQTLAGLIGVDRVLVMRGVKNTAKLGQTASMSYIGDKDALLVYVDPNPGVMTPTAGATLAWNGYLGANAVGGRLTDWYEPSKKSDVHELELAYQFKLRSADLGYFFAGAVA